MGRSKALAVPAYFTMVNIASLRAIWNLIRGERIDRWVPTRTTEPVRLTRPVPATAPTPATEPDDLTPPGSDVA
jgi:hypothetical protein